MNNSIPDLERRYGVRVLIFPLMDRTAADEAFSVMVRKIGTPAKPSRPLDHTAVCIGRVFRRKSKNKWCAEDWTGHLISKAYPKRGDAADRVLAIAKHCARLPE